MSRRQSRDAVEFDSLMDNRAMYVCTNNWDVLNWGALPDDIPVVIIPIDETPHDYVALILSFVLSVGVLAIMRCLLGRKKR